MFFRHGELPEVASCLARWAGLQGTRNNAQLVQLEEQTLPSASSFQTDAFEVCVLTPVQTVMVPAAAAMMLATKGVYRTHDGFIEAEAFVAQT